MNRDQQLAKISELLSEPESCKLGLEMVRRKNLAVTAQEMCKIILDTTLLTYQHTFLGRYVLNIDSRVFSNTEILDDGQFASLTQREIDLAKWKKPWGFDRNLDDGVYIQRQRESLVKMGVL